MDRATVFYANVFGLQTDRRKFSDFELAVFNPQETGISGGLAKRSDLQPGSGPELFFYVFDIHTAIERAVAAGGKMIKAKALIRQADENGQIVVPKTLIDNEVGYYAEITDSEGNRLAVYSNS